MAEGEGRPMFYFDDQTGYFYEEGEPDNPLDDIEILAAANMVAEQRDARFDAPRADVEAAFEWISDYALHSRECQRQAGADGVDEYDQCVCGLRSILDTIALSRLTQSPPRASGDGREEES